MRSAERRTKPAEEKLDTVSLENGERLTQPEFHRRYQLCPDDVKFELIGGIVYMASPLRRPHAHYEEELSFALGIYRRGTPGVELLPNATSAASRGYIPGHRKSARKITATRYPAQCQVSGSAALRRCHNVRPGPHRPHAPTRRLPGCQEPWRSVSLLWQSTGY